MFQNLKDILILNKILIQQIVNILINRNRQMTEPLTLTKLIILYMLNQVDFPLKKAQLLDFILGEDFNTNFFTLNQAFDELLESKFVETNSTHSTTFVNITKTGKDTLDFFQNRISEGIKNDISKYFESNKMEILNEVSVTSNYYRTSSGEYVAELSARDHSSDLINMKIYMPTEDSVESICNHWKSKSQDLYAYILENLL